MRFTTKIASAVAGLAIVMAGLAAAPANAATTIEADDTTALANGQTINITATGFPADADVYVLQCGDVATKKCDQGGIVIAHSDAEGVVETPFTVKAGDVGGAPCPGTNDAPCAILVTNAEQTAVAVLMIDLAPYVTVDPSNIAPADVDAEGMTEVALTGIGFTASSPAYILQCSAPSAANCDQATLVIGATDASGAIDTTFTVKQGDIGGGTCNTGDTCYVAVSTNPADADKTGFASFTYTEPVVQVASTTTLKFAKKTSTFSGVVKAGGKAVNKAKVTLQMKAKGKWKTVKAGLKTNATGAFSVKITKAKGTYRASTAAGKTYFASTSKPVVVKG